VAALNPALSQKIASACNNLPTIVLVTGDIFRGQKLLYAGGGGCFPIIPASGSATAASDDGRSAGAAD